MDPNAPFTIPFQAPQGSDGLEKKLEPFFKTVLMWRTWLKQALRDQGQGAHVSKLMSRIANSSDKTAKVIGDEKKNQMESKLLKWYKRWFIDNKLFEMQWQDIKNRAKDGGWLKKLLGFMALLAILGPKTVINILKMVAGFFIMFIKMFAAFLPKMIDAFVEFMIEVVPLFGKLLFELVKTMFGILVNYGKQFWNNLKTGNIGGALKSLAAFTLFIVSMGFVFKKLWSLMGPLQPLIKFLGSSILKFIGIIGKFVLPALKIAFTFLMGAVKALFATLMANPIILIVVGIIAALALLWKYADQVAEFFDGMIGWFKNLSGPMKVFVSRLAMLLWPITATIAGVYALVKAFQRIKKIGFAKFMQEVWAMIVASMRKIFNWDNIKTMFMSMVNSVVDGVSFLMVKAGQGIKDVAHGIWSSITGIFDSIKGIFGAFWVWARNRGDVSFNEAQSIQQLQMSTGTSSDVQKLVDRVKSGETLEEGDRAVVEAIAAKEGVSVEQLAKMDVAKYTDSIQALEEAIKANGANQAAFLKALGGNAAQQNSYRKVFDRVKATRGER